MATIPLYEIQLEDGTPVGVGTSLELTYWQSQGCMEGHRLGAVLGHEPASEDERRKVLWGVA